VTVVRSLLVSTWANVRHASACRDLNNGANMNRNPYFGKTENS